jgi:hypothetical protein
MRGSASAVPRALDVYSIDIRFDFDDVNASINDYQKIIDFKNRTSDSGLYSVSGQLVLFATSGSGDPSAESFAHDFTNGTMADLLVTRDATGLFRAFVNGHLAFSVMDTNGATTFSGPGNIINFFMDDLVSFAPEAGTGLVDYRLADEKREIILVACRKCAWRAAFARDELIATHGADYAMPNLLNHLAAPSCNRLSSHWDRCGVHYVEPIEGAR